MCRQYREYETFDLLGHIHHELSAVASETNDSKMCFYHTTILLEMRLQVCRKTGFPELRLAVAHNQQGVSWGMVGEYSKAIAESESRSEERRVGKECPV